MIETWKSTGRILTVAALLLSAACNVDAAGQIPCADDSSCPADYPVCKAGKCSTGTSSTATGVEIVGVQGHDPTDELRGTIVVSATARASSGVAQISLTAGSKTYAPDSTSTSPLYTFTIATTDFPDGDVSAVATVVAGDAQTASSPALTLHIDNTPPTLSIALVAGLNAAEGSLVKLDVTASEPLSSLTGTISASTAGTQLTEIAPATGNVHHFGYAVGAADAEGAHDVTLTGTDLAGNSSTQTASAVFSVRHPFSFGKLIASTGHTVNETPGALPAATAGTVVTLTTTLPASAFLGGAKPIFTLGTKTLPAPAATTSGSTVTWTTSYTVVSGDADGMLAAAVTVTDAAGNTPAPATATVVIDKTAPLLTGLTGNGQIVDASVAHGTVTFSLVASKRIKLAGISSNNNDQPGACTCDGVACSAATESETPLVVCTLTVTHGATSSQIDATAQLSLTDTLGNATPLTAAYQASYTVVALPVATSLIAATGTIGVGQSTVLSATFANGTPQITGSDGSAYALTNGQLTVSPTATTSYTLHVTNLAGSTASAAAQTVTVLQPATIGSLIAPPFYVVGQAVGALTATFGPAGASATVTGTDGFAAYTCSPSATTTSPATFNCQTPTHASDVTFTLTVTEGPVTATQSVTVKASPDPASTTQFSVSGANPVLPGGTTTFAGVVCTGCTYQLSPAVASSSVSGTTLTATSLALNDTTSFTLTVTDQAGATSSKTATVTVSKPTIASFTGPIWSTSGVGNIKLVATFGGGAGASASVVATSGTTSSTCTPAASTSSPATFTCSAITQDTTYTLTNTLGTGPSSTTTAALTVKVAAAPATNLTFNVTGPNPINPGATSTLSGSICSGCTAVIDPAASLSNSATIVTPTFSVDTAPLQQTTLFTLTVTNPAGATTIATQTVSVNHPVVTGFTGPAWAISGAAGFTLTASFGGGPGATAAVVAIAGSSPTCATGTPTTSPATFTCGAITQDTTFQLTITLGTGASATATATLVVKAAAAAAGTLNASSTTANPGDVVTLSGTLCTGCTATLSPASALTSTSVSGATYSVLTAALTQTTQFTLTVTDLTGGQAVVTKTVTVNQPSIATFTGPVWATTGAAGIPLQLTFTGASASVAATAGTTTSTCTPASATSSPATFTCSAIAADTTYTATVMLGTASATASLLVKVSALPSTNLALGLSSGAQNPINPGDTTTLAGTLCAGCTGTLSPSSGVVTNIFNSSPFTVSTRALTATTVFTLTATNQAGAQAQASFTVTVNAPAVLSFTGPAWATNGSGNVTLNASFTGASASVAATSGTTTSACSPSSTTTSPQAFSCTPIAADTVFTLTVSLGTVPNVATTTASVTVKVAPTPGTGIGLTAVPATVNPGGTSSLSGTICTGCTATLSPPALVTTSSFNGNFSNIATLALTQTTAFTLTVTNQAGAQTSTAQTVTVTPPQITSFSGPAWATSGQDTITLAATFAPAGTGVAVTASPAGSTCTLNAPGTSPATFTCTPITADTTYTLTATLGSGSSSTLQQTLLVKAAPLPAPALTLTPASVNPGQTTALTGTGICTGCTFTLDPAPASASVASNTLTATSAALAQTTTFTLSVTNQAGFKVTAPTTNSTVTVRQPSVTAFDGPVNWQTGKANLPLTATFGPGVAGALAAATGTVTSNTGSTCTPTGVTSPAAFTCTAITANTTFTLTVTLGTATTIATVNVNAGPVDTTSAGTVGTRFLAAETLLPNGRIFIAGGAADLTGTSPLNTAVIYNPSTGTFTNAGQGACGASGSHMVSGRFYATATLLTNGTVLVAGGASSNSGGLAANALASADIYNPGTDCFVGANNLLLARYGHTATLLPTGDVLIAGGQGIDPNTSLVSAFNEAELYTSGAFHVLSNTMNAQRAGGTATLLRNGLVLLAGGVPGAAPAPADLYDPSFQTFTATTGSGAARTQHTATLLGDGTVLLAGGNRGFLGTAGNEIGTAEIFNPNGQTFTATGSLNFPRWLHSAILLPSNSVLVAGGEINSGGTPAPTAKTEIFDPATGVWSNGASMSVARAGAVSDFLFNGSAFVAGGAASTAFADLLTP